MSEKTWMVEEYEALELLLFFGAAIDPTAFLAAPIWSLVVIALTSIYLNYRRYN
jgi:hypothetical protein